MATFKGVITAISQMQSGTSRNGKQWQRIEVCLTYDNSKAEYPKAIVFSVMNDNIGKLDLKQGAEYEVEVDFSAREYNGRYYMNATAWRATPTQQPIQQPATQAEDVSVQPMQQTDDPPF